MRYPNAEGALGRIATVTPLWLLRLPRPFRDRWRGPVLSLLLTAPSWIPFLLPQMSLWQLHDGEAHLLRTFFLQELIADGNWYPRWMPQQYGGYGYPTLNFYAPGLYYATWLIAQMTPLGLYEALQIVGAAGAAGIALGTYSLGWRAWRDEPAALLAAGAVAYAPYLLPANLYISGGLPAVLGPAIIVWLLVCCHTLWDRQATGRAIAPWWWAVAGLTAAIMLTHNVSALLGGAMTALWVVCLALWTPGLRTRRAVATAVRWAAPLVGAALLGTLATAFFWLPALAETSLVQVERLNRGNLHFRNHFITWPGFHSGVWGEQWRGPWTAGSPVDLHLVYPHSLYGPPRLGLWQALICALALLALVVWVTRRGGRVTSSLPALSVSFGLVIAIGAYAQSFDWALPYWERLAALRAIQLPSRLLGPAVIGVGIAAGGALALSGSRGRRSWVVACCAVLVLGMTGSAARQIPFDAQASSAVNVATAIGRERVQPGSTASTNEFLPRTSDYQEWHEGEARGFWLFDRLFPEAGWLGGRIRVSEGAASIRSLSGGALWTEALVNVPESSQAATLAFHQLAFPGWRAWVDGQQVAIRSAPLIAAQAIQPGFILVDVPAGSHQVSIRFGPSVPRLAGAAISLAILVAASVWLWRRVRWREGDRFVGGGLWLIATAGIVVAAARTLAPLWPPVGEAQRAVVVLNIANEVSAGRARISSPSGAGFGRDMFVDVRHLAVTAQDRPLRDAGPGAREWLYMHPASRVEVEFTVPQDAYFQTALALDPATWDAPVGDGVQFIASAAATDGPSGEAAVVLDATLNPRAQGEQRRWVEQVVDLRRWTGRRMRLTLETTGRQHPAYDWAGWGDPAIVRLDPLTAARLVDSSERIAKVTNAILG